MLPPPTPNTEHPTPNTTNKENTMKNTVEATVKNHLVDQHGLSKNEINDLVEQVNLYTDDEWEKETTTCTVEVTYTVTYSAMIYEVEVEDPFSVEDSELLDAMNVSNADDYRWEYDGSIDYSELEVVNVEPDS